MPISAHVRWLPAGAPTFVVRCRVQWVPVYELEGHRAGGKVDGIMIIEINGRNRDFFGVSLQSVHEHQLDG